MTENERLLIMLERMLNVNEVVKDIVKLYAMLSDKKSDQGGVYRTIDQHMHRYGIKQIALANALMLSKEAAALSREQGYEIRKADDERFGFVNSYHVDVLDQVFQL